MASLRSFRLFTSSGTILGAILFATSALADSEILAYRIFNRLNGTPPSPEKLAEIRALLDKGQELDAALLAINDPSGQFYNTVLKNFFSRWASVDGSPRNGLSDMVALAIGAVRDDLAFGRILYDDLAYGPPNANDLRTLETINANLRDPAVLPQRGQTTVPPAAIAGVFSTQAFGRAYYQAGTNRRAFQASMTNFLCRPMESLKDATRSDERVRGDVARQPGGYAAKYVNECKGCHAGMDGLAGAFAYYDFGQALTYTPGQVVAKYRNREPSNTAIGVTGYATTDDSWVNLWAQGPNASMGWPAEVTGRGAQAFGQMLAKTDAFAQCMSKQALESMCGISLAESASPKKEDLAQVETMTTAFKRDQNMKATFAAASVYCAKRKFTK